MHPRTFQPAYSSVRHYEYPPSAPRLVCPTQHPNISAVLTLANLHEEVRKLREVESDLQRQIQYHRSFLDEVQTMLHTKVNKANEMQNFLAPISRLPNEMLLAIFEEAVSCQETDTERRIECTISMVSRRWRDLAIHSPRLWRRVCITPRVAPGVLEMYKTRGSRVLDIDVCGWRDRKDYQRFDAALEAMLDSSSRWRSLSISNICDTNLSHLTLKLSHVGNFCGLRHFVFRALRPGQTCSISFLMETNIRALKSLDAENFVLPGDTVNNSAFSRTAQAFSRLSSLTLRRYSNDARPLRVMIDSTAFRNMINTIPNLTTLALHGQPLRFRSSSDSHPQAYPQEESTLLSLPYLQTLILHPGVLKPRFLQQTISSIHAPALRHFELVFPASKFSGQNVVDLLFDSSKRPRFPLVDTVVLHNASNSGTALSFVHAFPYTAQAIIGGVDVGFFPLVLRAGMYDASCTRFAYWHRLRCLTLYQPRRETLDVVRDWIQSEHDRGHALPMLIVEGAIDRHDIQCFCQRSRMYTRIDLIDIPTATAL